MSMKGDVFMVVIDIDTGGEGVLRMLRGRYIVSEQGLWGIWEGFGCGGVDLMQRY